MDTFMPKPHQMDEKWYILDAKGRVLGHVATEAARLLRGKHKPIFTPNLDTGDHVIIINAAKVELTGNKLDGKIKYRHSGYPGGLKSTDYRTLMQKNPQRVVMMAVRGMIPHNRMGRKLMKKIRIYNGAEHQHQAQGPEVWDY